MAKCPNCKAEIELIQHLSKPAMGEGRCACSGNKVVIVTPLPKRRKRKAKPLVDEKKIGDENDESDT